MGPRKKPKLKSALNNLIAQAKAGEQQRQRQARLEQEAKKKSQGPPSKEVVHPLRALTSDDTILLIGEGNFSFARSIADHSLDRNDIHMVATCLDSEEVLYQKYGDQAKGNVDFLQSLDCTVLFSVDGTQLEKNKFIRKQKFSKIIFNFPHAGAGIKDQDRNVRANQELLRAFFQSALSVLANSKTHRDDSEASTHDKDVPEGEIHVTIKTCKPYNLWNVRGLARSCGLALKTTRHFRPDEFTGYEHRRTLGFKEGVSKDNNAEILQSEPKTFVFVRSAVMQGEIQKSIEGTLRKNLEKNDTKKRKHSVHTENDNDSD